MTAVVNPADFLPMPDAIAPLDNEVLFQQWLTDFVARYPDFDVGRLETDPGVIVAQAMSFVRLLDRAHVNDAYRALRLSLATGADLEGLAADLSVTRLVYREATLNDAAVLESDNALRLRTWLRIQSFGTGSPLGVEYHARTNGLGDIADAHVIDYPGEGYMDLILLPPPDDEIADLEDFDFAAVVARVGSYVMDRARRPGSVWINTMAAETITVNLAGTIHIRRGASKATNLAASEATWRAYMASRRNIGADIPFSAVDDAVITRDIVKFEWAGGPVDIPITEKQAAQAGAFAVTAEWTDE